MKNLPIKNILFLVITGMLFSYFSLHFWKNEMGTGYISSLQHQMRDNTWTPYAGLLVCCFLAVQQIIAIKVLRKTSLLKAIAYGIIFFCSSLFVFYYYKNLLCSICLVGWFKLSLPCDLMAFFIITPVFSVFLEFTLTKLAIPIHRKFSFYLWISIQLSVILAIISYFIFIDNDLGYEIIQQGHPIRWLFFLLVIPFIIPPKNDIVTRELVRPPITRYMAVTGLFILTLLLLSLGSDENHLFHFANMSFVICLFIAAYQGSKFIRNLLLMILSITFLLLILNLFEMNKLLVITPIAIITGAAIYTIFQIKRPRPSEKIES